MSVRKFVYIGQKFYMQSGYRMGSFYELFPNGSLIRAGIGDLEAALMDGCEIYARPANKKEMTYANEQLQGILSR